MNSPARGAGTFPALVAAARQHRASTRQVTLLTVRFIAERARAVLPDAAFVGLRWSAEGNWLELAGFFTDAETEITGEAVRERLALLEADLMPAPVTNRDNEGTWRPYTTDTAPDGYVLDGEYRLIIAKALTATDPARPCGCPDAGPAVVAGVEIPRHDPDCSGAVLRTYAWMDDGRLVTGTLADYARAYALAADESLPAREISTEVRTWDAGYHVRAEALAAAPDDDGCWPIRLSVPGEQVTVSVWALTCPCPPAPGGPASAGWPTPEPWPAYEGQVVFADGSHVSLQCYHGDHWRCPDIPRRARSAKAARSTATTANAPAARPTSRVPGSGLPASAFTTRTSDGSPATPTCPAAMPTP
jgi:hypothetical protein